MTDPGVSTAFCEAIAATRYEDLPGTTVTAAKRVFLDAVGVMLGASGIAPEIGPFVDLASRTHGPSAILGTGLTCAPAQAAFANGAMAHALDYEDAFDLAPGHPNASLVPALLALAQARGQTGGKTFLTALAAGGDASCRVALALERRMEEGGWYPPPITAAIGAAMGAGRLLGLDGARLRDCISLQMCQSVMPGEIKYSAQTVLRAVREAFPAQSAVVAAELAEAGVAGFEEPLEGKSGFYALYAGGQFSSERLLADIGSRFWIDELTFKPWPSCRGTHPFIEMALDLSREIDDPLQVESITVEVSHMQQMLVEPLARKQAPLVVIDAKFSIPFTFALALARGQVGLDDFAAASLADQEILRLAERVTAKVVEAKGRNTGAGGAVTVKLCDGSELFREVANASGAPDRPMGEDALRAKFVDCAMRARRPLSADVAEELAERILDLENCPDVGALFT